MAWNSRQSKSLDAPSVKAAALGPGAPVSLHPGTTGKAYRDSWDIERAYRDGMQKVTWVGRCIDAIAGNQARLPVILRKNNDPNGEILTRRHRLSDLLNVKANEGENSFIFRYRLSSQLLLSTRGVFIEKVFGRNGSLIGLNLLPPQFTSPIPDPKRFVSGFQVDLPNGMRQIIPPEKVVWIRRPHPLDPYLSMTPMESAGVAIEIENLARLYNRNYLLNDGRPGGLLVVRGEIDDDDKDELRSRFRGNLGTTGHTTVISSDDGVDYVDTSANPRDAAYIEMRRITKEEILAAFGVPESVIGNASGRCLRQSEMVRLASGERVRAGDLVGKNFTLMTSSDCGHIEVPAWATLEQVEMCYRVTTESGKVLETNGRHPLFAARYVKTKDAGWRSENGPRLELNGWTPVSELVDGDWVIAVPTVISPTSHNDLTEDEAFVLGALVGDGTMTGDGKPVALTTPEGPFPKRFVQAVEAIGDEVIHVTPKDRIDVWRVRAKKENRVGSGRGSRNSVKTRVLLRSAGLMGTKSGTKFIPEIVFGASNAALASFLGGLYAADGSVHVGKPTGSKNPYGIVSITLVTVSERLARDVQEALLRFGVQSRLRFRENLSSGIESLEGRKFSSWEIAVSDSESILNFAASIEVPGKQDKIDQIAINAEEKLNRGRIERWSTRDLNPGLRWERVTNVEEVGVDQTIGIMVPEHHTYLSLMWEHNTFANAAEEHRVFWNETMLPHLEPLARALDELDDSYYVDFDKSDVPILILYKQERERYLMQEFQTGLISANEYRRGSGRKTVESEIADQLLANPNLVPIANTEKPFSMEEQAPIAEGGAVPGPGMPGVPGVPGMPGVPEGMMGPDQAAQIMGQGVVPVEAAPEAAVVPVPEGQLSERTSSIQTKMLNQALVDWETKADQSTERWTEIVEATLDRFFERQQRVVLEKATGAKARKSMRERTFDVDQVFDQSTWERQIAEDMRPLFKAVLLDAAGGVDSSFEQMFDSDEVDAYLTSQVERVQKINASTKDEIAAAILTSLALPGDEDEKFSLLKAALTATFADIGLKRKRLIAEHETQTAFNAGVFFGSIGAGVPRKKWVARSDDRVRAAHRVLNGKSVGVGEGFVVDGVGLRFPGDPAAPASLTMNCRCKLRYEV